VAAIGAKINVAIPLRKKQRHVFQTSRGGQYLSICLNNTQERTKLINHMGETFVMP